MDWLQYQDPARYEWHLDAKGEKRQFYRKLGVVENLFDSDGFDYEGRADLNIHVNLKLRITLDEAAFRQRIMLVWSVLRQQRVLLSTRSQVIRAINGSDHNNLWSDNCFVYEMPSDSERAIADGSQTITFVGDHYSPVNTDMFMKHLLNTARAINGTVNLARLFVLPFEVFNDRIISMDIVLVAAHEIADGLTTFRWTNHLIKLLNLSEESLKEQLAMLCSDTKGVFERLPPPQEAIYPPLASRPAMLRWKWLLTRILRHVRRPPAESFQNPLRRSTTLDGAENIPHYYPKVLDYSRRPPLNCYSIVFDLSKTSTNNLVRICREAGISIGSGSFALVAIAMMRFEEMRDPSTPLWKRLPFVGSFPVDPRPFLMKATTGSEDSLMLAFSDGITLPFLPSSVDFRKSLKVLGRLAHRQLRQFQKKAQAATRELDIGSRSKNQLLPSLYLATMERLEMKVKPEQRIGMNIQGAFPARYGKSLATCGISSVGDRTRLISSGKFNVNDIDGRIVTADFHSSRASVRARDGEFLVGISGTLDCMGFLVSYDGSAIDPAKAEQWRDVMMGLLERDGGVNNQFTPSL